jgi:hypothetical protein
MPQRHLTHTHNHTHTNTQAQEKSIQHAKEALGMTESTLNNRLLVLEKELNASQAATMTQEREVARLLREVKDRESQGQELRAALEVLKERQSICQQMKIIH